VTSNFTTKTYLLPLIFPNTRASFSGSLRLAALESFRLTRPNLFTGFIHSSASCNKPFLRSLPLFPSFIRQFVSHPFAFSMRGLSGIVAAATSMLIARAVAGIDPIVIKGSKFFYGTNGTQL
jgi:hypothetical protein